MASIDEGTLSSMAYDANNVHLKYKGQRPRRKLRPVVHIKENGELTTTMEHFQHENDFHFNQPIDKYFKNDKVNKLIYETR